jgi:CheY-like chemotaxis protein
MAAKLRRFGPHRALLLRVMPRLLVIDDDADLRMAVTEYLSSLGYEIHETLGEVVRTCLSQREQKEL